MVVAVDYDVVIIGAGVGGINAAYRVQEQSPDSTYTIIEGRGAVGGTWDLFKYPGIRSDSDLHTFGFDWRPWTDSHTIGGGAKIRKYVEESAAQYGILDNIKFNTLVKAQEWSSADQAWTVTVESQGKTSSIKARFIIHGTGYYDYNEPLKTDIPGLDKYQGQIIHPQFWPEDLDYSDKNIVIIGSGATAITLLPNLVPKAKHVTMLQRSPTYLMSLPPKDPTAEVLKKILPLSWAYKLIRLKFLILPMLFFKFCRAFPGPARSVLRLVAKQHLPKGYDLDPNFNPRYGPWEQRLCVCPDGDFYRILGTPKASVVTGVIETVTEKTIVVKDSAEVLRPDIIVTATGLKVSMLGGSKVIVDGKPITIGQQYLWNGSMISDIPNLFVIIGYTNASWTLGADATSFFLTRIINTMRKRNQTSLTPTLPKGEVMKDQGILNLNSTYIVKAEGQLLKAGDRAPWLPRQDYFTDMAYAKTGDIEIDAVYA